MATITNISINSPLAPDQFASVCDFSPGAQPAMQNFINYLDSLVGGLNSAELTIHENGERATGNIQFLAPGPADGSVLVLLGFYFTAVTIPAGDQSFVISGDGHVTATNFYNTVLNSVWGSLSEFITMELDNSNPSYGQVTFTAIEPGIVCNAYVLDQAGAFDNTNFNSFIGGTDGDSFVIAMG